MSDTINEEVISYLREISRLQDKIKEIEKTCSDYDTFKYNICADHNMSVLKTWLENKEQLQYDRLSQEAYDDFMYYKKREKKIGHDIKLLRCSGLRKHKIIYNEYKQKYHDAMINFYKYHGDKNTSVSTPSGTIYINEIKINRPTQHGFHEVNKRGPSPFMKDFIEATYSLFQNQQQRIEELEAKLA